MDGYNEFLVNTGKKRTLAEDTITKPMSAEKSDIFFGNRAIGEQSVGILRADQIITGRVQGPGGDVFFDLDDSLIQLSDGTNPRIILDGENGKFVVSRPGFDANTATAAQSLINIGPGGTSQLLQATWSNSASAQNNDFGIFGGFINYDSTGGGLNYYTHIDFYIPSNWQVLSGKLEMRSFDWGYNNGGGYVLTRANNVAARLNATKNVNGGGADAYYWTFSGGQAIVTGLNPASDDQAFSYTLTPTQIGSITTGWNKVICQQEVSSQTNFGTMAMNLFIEYIVTIT
jgi:hypothetical protein